MTNERRQAEIRTFLLPLTLDDSNNNVFCLFSQNQVVEILGRRPVQRIPMSPNYLKGVLPYQDQLLPVINLDALCSRKSTAGQEGYRQLVVIRTGVVDSATGEPLKAAITASARVRIAKLSAQALATAFVEQEAPASLKNSGVLRGFFQQQANFIALIDLNQVLLGTSRDPGQVA